MRTTRTRRSCHRAAAPASARRSAPHWAGARRRAHRPPAAAGPAQRHRRGARRRPARHRRRRPGRRSGQRRAVQAHRQARQGRPRPRHRRARRAVARQGRSASRAWGRPRCGPRSGWRAEAQRSAAGSSPSRSRTARGSPSSSRRIAPPGQYGCGGRARCRSARLVDPGAGVRDPRGPARAAPARRVVARERAGAVDVAEEDPVGLDPEAVRHARQRRDARALHLEAEQARGHRRQAAAGHPRQGRHGRRPQRARPGRRRGRPGAAAASASAAPRPG